MDLIRKSDLKNYWITLQLLFFSLSAELSWNPILSMWAFVLDLKLSIFVSFCSNLRLDRRFKIRTFCTEVVYFGTKMTDRTIVTWHQNGLIMILNPSTKNFFMHLTESFLGQKTLFRKNWTFFVNKNFSMGVDILLAKLPSWFDNLV